MIRAGSTQLTLRNVSLFHVTVHHLIAKFIVKLKLFVGDSDNHLIPPVLVYRLLQPVVDDVFEWIPVQAGVCEVVIVLQRLSKLLHVEWGTLETVVVFDSRLLLVSLLVVLRNIAESGVRYFRSKLSIFGEELMNEVRSIELVLVEIFDVLIGSG